MIQNKLYIIYMKLKIIISIKTKHVSYFIEINFLKINFLLLNFDPKIVLLYSFLKESV